MRRRIVPIWTCTCLIILLFGTSVSAQTTIRYDEYTYETPNVGLEVTDDPSLQSSPDFSSEQSSDRVTDDDALLSSSERSSNAITEASLEIIKKHSSKKVEPHDKSNSKSSDKSESSTPGTLLIGQIHESKRSSEPIFVPLNVTAHTKKPRVESKFEATTEGQDKTEFDSSSTINYSSSDVAGMVSGDSESPSMVTSNNSPPNMITSYSDSTSKFASTRNSSRSTNAYQMKKTPALHKDYYSEGSTVSADTVSISSLPGIPSIQNTQNSSKRFSFLGNSTVSYKVLTDSSESSPPMLTFVTTTTPVSTVPVLPETQTIIEDSSTNPSVKSSLGVSEVLSTKRELKTTTPENDSVTSINGEEQPTTIATITATAMSTVKLLTSKILTVPQSMTTTTNASVNASIETSKISAATSATTTVTPIETTKPMVITPAGTSHMEINTTMSSTVSTSSSVETTTKTTTVPTIETTELTTQVPTTVTMLTPIVTVTTPTVNRITTPSSKTTTSSISKTKSSDSTLEVEKTTESTPVTSANIPPKALDTPKISDDSVIAYVQIVMAGTWEEICLKLSSLTQSLANLITKNIETTISAQQIVIYKSRCPVDTTPTSFKNPLTPVLVFVINENKSFNETLTKMLPELYQKEPFEFTPKIQSIKLIEDSVSGNSIVVILVISVSFICIILIGGLIFVMKKRQSRFNYGERCRPVSLDAYSLDSVSAHNSIRRNKAALRSSKRSYGNPSFEDSSAMPTHPINFARLTTFCNETNAIVEEFGTIPQVSSKIDELPIGAELKNRYANVIPLPETRVYLQAINNDPTTEYINASYVRGPKNADKFYIASQAPTENTVIDFWRMIWEQQCKVIIMLTDLVENGVEKCTEYVPPLEVSDCHRLYGDYQVTLKKREAKDKYAISTLLLKNLEKNVYREVWHIWYLWPTKGVPKDPAGLISVLQEARALQRGSKTPILVHCSPGTGRTGAVIAIDLCIRQFEITRAVDVPRTVYSIRRDRAGAVQTREQYGFIYKAISYYADKLTGGAIESV